MIPEAAVEAAYNSIIGGNEVTGPDIALDLLSREQVLLILEAAAPHLLQAAKAEAWEEGSEAGSDNQCAWDGWRYSKGYPLTNPYR